MNVQSQRKTRVAAGPQTTEDERPARNNKGHVGLLACSGMLNGFFGEGDERHIAQWRVVKHVDEFNEEGEEAGETIIRRRERFSHELTLAFENGRLLELKETKDDVANGTAERSQEHEHSVAM